MIRGFRLVLCSTAMVAIALGLTGCGDSDGFKLAPVKGKVVYKGQPVTAGSLTFRPLGSGNSEKAAALGKPATAEVKEDGTFVVTTEKPGDGAVVGKHQVMFTPVSIAAKSYDDKPPQSPYVGLTPKQSEVEVKGGAPNDLEIELVPQTGLAPPTAKQ